MATLATTQSPVTNHRFSVMWINHPVTWDREMSRHVFPIRDWLPAAREHPYETWDIYLDQVHVILNPVEALTEADADPANSFAYEMGDSADYDFRVETYQLLVRFDPNGERHVLYTESAADPNTNDRVGQVVTPTYYSSSLTLQNVDAGEKYNRVYRPVRPDLPIARNVAPYHFGSPLTLELGWPILMANTAANILSYVPNYRILRVLCDFSCRRR